ncbi:MAG TPA: hypothetical protein VFR86_11005 [Burkholderiaceae bacterium]|nr:hypothetical protein [Burkholderiaceae bacterium]
MRTEGRLLLLAGCLATAGCATQIEALRVAPATEGQPVEVAARIAGGALASAPTPQIEVRPESAGASYVVAGRMQPAGNDEFRATLPPQAYGQHRVRVHVANATPPAREQTFFVAARRGCFAFDGDPTPQGWSLQGIFDNGNPGVQVSLCRAGSRIFGSDDVPVRVADANYPELYARDIAGELGALSVALVPACFPTRLPSGRRWTMDFVSPDLSQNADWQVGRFSFALRASDAAALAKEQQPQVQAMLKVRQRDGAVRYYAEQIDGQAFRYETVGPEWQRFVFSFDAPVDSTVLEARVRFFGAAAQHEANGRVQLDLVCPEGRRTGP